MTLCLPLSSYPVGSTGDFDWYRQSVQDRYRYVHDVDKVGGGPFSIRVNAVQFARSYLSTSQTSGFSFKAGDNTSFALVLNGHATLDCGQGPETVGGHTNGAMLVGEGHCRFAPGFAAVFFHCDPADMIRCMGDINGAALLSIPPQLVGAQQATAHFISTLRAVLEQLDRGEWLPGSRSRAMAVYEDMLILAMANTVLLGAGFGARRPLDTGPLARAEEFIAANLAEALTPTLIARAAGMSVRALHYAFRQNRARTPGEFVRERRLDRARDLLADAASRTVTEVALDCGFNHMGDFSAAYRRRFGETPSQTLRRSSGSHLPVERPVPSTNYRMRATSVRSAQGRPALD
jgi:AraC-like DNA-binding protein